jgi:uncharacterized membrane protein YhaH (DUF805 family)
MKYYLKALQHYADFSGRASRNEYWMFILFNILFAIAVAFIGIFLGAIKDENYIKLYMSQFLILYYAAIIIPLLAISVRRLHDSGKSGWWMLLALLPPLSNIPSNMKNFDDNLFAVIAIITILSQITILIFLLLKGKDDKNRYGENPKRVRTFFDERKRTKSLGLTLIIAAGLSVVSQFIFWLSVYGSIPSDILFLIKNGIVFKLLILVSGILLLQKTDKTKSFAIVLIVAAGFSLILLMSEIIDYFSTINIISLLRSFVPDAALLLAGIVLLQRNKEHKTISPKFASISLIIAALLMIIVFIYFSIIQPDYMSYMYENGMAFICNMFYILMPVAFLFLASYLLPLKNAQSYDPEIDNDNENENNQQAAPEQQSLWKKILGLFVSIFMIWGGLSGELVLRGTESSTALVILGFLLLIFDIYAIATHKKIKN